MEEHPAKSKQTMTLVPNQVVLDLRLATYHAQAGQPGVFKAPPIQIFTHWMADLSRKADWLAGEFSPSVPGSFPVRSLWEAVIAKDHPDWAAAECSAMAATAMDADRLLIHWAQSDTGFSGGAAWRQFMRWRSRVHEALAKRAWQTPAQQLWRLQQQVRHGRIAKELLPGRLQLDGFAELTALEQSLLDGLEQTGTEVVQVEPLHAREPDWQLLSFDSLAEELQWAAQWARRHLQGGTARIAIIVNDLNRVRRPLQRCFDDEFNAQSTLAFMTAVSSPYRICAGVPLVSHPLVHAALDIIEMALAGPRRQQDFPRVSSFLLNACLAGADQERHARGLLERRLRETSGYRWSLSRVGELSTDLPLDILREKIARMPTTTSDLAPEASLQRLLEYWGWPGPLNRDTRADAAVRRFLGLFEVLGVMGLETPQAAFRELSRMCAEENWSESGGALSPIQLMSPENACGGDFSAVLMVNFHAGNWPGPVVQNPLLPGAVNRMIPRAGNDGQLEYTQRLHRALTVNCDTCTWSRWHDGAPRMRSPMMPVDLDAHDQEITHQPLSLRVFPLLEEVTGLAHHPWLQERPFSVATGLGAGSLQLDRVVSVVELQSACPMAAFLVHRLAATFPPPPSPFASPAFTGTLVHRALERLYQPHLANATRPNKEEIAAVVDESMKFCHADRVLPPVVFAAEQARLADLLADWLDAEERMPLGQPMQLEQKLDIEWSGFQFRIRADRLDRTPDGRLLVIDYKTGVLPPVRWASDRLTQPQLPLYAVLLQSMGEVSIGGVAQVSVRKEEMKRRGLVDDPALSGGGLEGFDKPGALARSLGSWDEAMHAWSVQLASLLDEYRSGDCRHVVWHEPALAYLGLEPLLRHESLAAWAQARGDFEHA